MDDARAFASASGEPVSGAVDWRADDAPVDPAMRTDGELLDAWRRHHDEAAFSEICRRHLPLVRRICERCRAPDPDEAVQAVLILLADRQRNRPGGDDLGGWLVVTARHIVSTQQRSAMRRLRHEGDAAREDQRLRQAPSEGGDAAILPRLDQALAALSAGRREAVVRYYLQGQAPSHIARELGCSVGAVRVRIHEGLEKLRATLTRQGAPVAGAGLVALLGAECHAGQAMDAAALVQAAMHPAQAPAAAALAKSAMAGWPVLTMGLAAGGLVVVAAMGIAVASGFHQEPSLPMAPVPVAAAAPDAAMARWREATIGMGITWGLHALAAERWQERPAIGSSTDRLMMSASIPLAEYQKLAKDFRGEGFDAEALAALAQGAGARYLCVMAKDRDGFAMYDSRVSDYNVVRATPFARDALAGLAAACRKRGLLFGVEYALITDWQDPDGMGNRLDFPGPKRFDAYLERKALPQIRELVERHRPDLFFAYEMDGSLLGEQRSRDVMDAVRSRKPDCLVNRGLTAEQMQAVVDGALAIPAGRFASSRMNVPPDGPLPCAFEITTTCQNGWGYDPLNDRWFDTRKIIQGLVEVVAKGGNARMHIALDPAGRVPAPVRDRLAGIGAWLAVNGTAVHGCQPSPFRTMSGDPAPAWRCTRRDRTLFFTFVSWPGPGAFSLPPLHVGVERAWLLADAARTPLTCTRVGDAWQVILPETPPDPLLPVLAVACAGDLPGP